MRLGKICYNQDLITLNPFLSLSFLSFSLEFSNLPVKYVSNLHTLVSFSESLADHFEKDPDFVTCSHVGPGLARYFQTGPQAPMKKSEVSCKRQGVFQVSLSLDLCVSLYYSDSFLGLALPSSFWSLLCVLCLIMICYFILT